jgi:hypothetical protein
MEMITIMFICNEYSMSISTCKSRGSDIQLTMTEDRFRYKKAYTLQYMPYLLFIVKAKQTYIESCLLFNTNNNWESEWDITICGMNTLSSTRVSDMILASNIRFNNWVTKSLVSLQSPSLWFKLRSNIIEIPTFW